MKKYKINLPNYKDQRFIDMGIGKKKYYLFLVDNMISPSALSDNLIEKYVLSGRFTLETEFVYNNEDLFDYSFL